MTVLRDDRHRRHRDAIIDERALDSIPRDDLVELAAVLLFAVEDPHRASSRPCPTCDPISLVVGKPIGCAKFRLRYAGRRDEPYQTEPTVGAS